MPNTRLRTVTHRNCHITAATVASAILLAATAFADSKPRNDWPNWRGPAYDGISTSTNWSSAKVTASAKVLWNVNVGIGYSAITVAEGRVYTAGWRDGKDHVLCLNPTTGRTQWSYSYPADLYANSHEGGPSSTPAFDGERIYIVSRDIRMFCLDAGSGKLVWQRDLRKDYGVQIPKWGFSGSPIIWGKGVLVDAGRTIALDRKTGEEIWKTRDYSTGYSTPCPFTIGDKRMLAVFPAYGLVILDAANGNEIASRPWRTDHGVNAVMPIIHGNRIFISSGYNTGAALFELAGSELQVVWQNRNMRNHMNTSILIDGHLYGFDESLLKCLDFNTGTVKWEKRGLGKGSLMATNDKLIVLSENGELIIAGATAAAYEEIGKAKVLQDNRCWTVPTLAEGRIYARGKSGELACIDVSK